MHPDGRRDSSFGSNGAVAVLPPPSATGIFTAGLEVLSDGSFVVPVTASDATTYLSSSIYKWTAQGAADTSFGINGVAEVPGKTRVHDMGVQQDGRILIVGEYDDTPSRLGIVAVVVRFTAAGTQDPEFGRQGFVVMPWATIGHIELERSGRILVGAISGSSWRVFQLLSNGEFASDFMHTLIPDHGFPGDTIERPSSPAAILDMARGDGLFLLTSNVDAKGLQSTVHIEKMVLGASPNRGSLSTGQAPSLSGFLVDMRNLGGALVDTAASSHVVGFDGYIFPQNTDVGSSADIFVVAQTPNGMYMRTVAGYFVRWSNRLADLVPAYENVPLKAPKVHVPIYGGQLPYTGPYLLYIGYMRTDGGPLIYMKEPMSFHILP